MGKGKIFVWFIVFILVVITCLVLFVLLMSRPSSTHRVLGPEKIRSMVKQMTGRDLPTDVENFRGVELGYDRYVRVFLAFETSQNGLSYILDTFDKHDVKREDFPHEMNKPEDLGPRIFWMVREFQDKLGVVQIDKDLCNKLWHDNMEYMNNGTYPTNAVSGSYLRSNDSCSVYYYCLIFKDLGLVYMFLTNDISEGR